MRTNQLPQIGFSGFPSGQLPLFSSSQLSPGQLPSTPLPLFPSTSLSSVGQLPLVQLSQSSFQLPSIEQLPSIQPMDIERFPSFSLPSVSLPSVGSPQHHLSLSVGQFSTSPSLSVRSSFSTFTSPVRWTVLNITTPKFFGIIHSNISK